MTTTNSQNREVYLFQKSVAPGESGRLSQEIPANGILEKLTVRFYVGAELNLEIEPSIIRLGNMRDHLVRYTGLTSLKGDDDKFIFNLSTPVYYQEELEVFYENTLDPEEYGEEYSYNFVVIFEIDHIGKPYEETIGGGS